MLIPKQIKKMKAFVGRQAERKRLAALGESKESSILIVYGRRRIGKTELLEQVYADRNILKFEGIQGRSQKAQRDYVLWQLSEYVQNSLIAKIKVVSWLEVFKLIYDNLPEGDRWTLYFEEFQWLADYKDDFISELKFAWDNYFRYRERCLIVLCGSSPSFIVNQEILSKSLYNRSQHELHLREFSLAETQQFLSSKSCREVMDAYLTVGGIPEYLKWCKTSSSVFSSICHNSFSPDSFFSMEFERIFVSSLSENKHYKKIIEFLGNVRFASREDILRHLKLTSSGYITEVLTDIELCGFIEKYTPYHLSQESVLSRYCISDSYLQFYYKFIKPEMVEIRQGAYRETPTLAIKMDSYQKWLGYAFERFCRRRHQLIAKILGFHGIHYRAGAFFNKNTQKKDPGFQWDLVFDRDDQVLTLCEMKYSQSKIGIGIIEEFERKLELSSFQKRKTIQKVLVTTEGANDALLARHYFDRVITLEELFAVDA